jgi:hypothetical protein
MLTLRLQTPIAVVVLEGAQNLLGTGLTMHALQSLDPNLIISPVNSPKVPTSQPRRTSSI